MSNDNRIVPPNLHRNEERYNTPNFNSPGNAGQSTENDTGDKRSVDQRQKDAAKAQKDSDKGKLPSGLGSQAEDESAPHPAPLVTIVEPGPVNAPHEVPVSKVPAGSKIIK